MPTRNGVSCCAKAGAADATISTTAMTRIANCIAVLRAFPVAIALRLGSNASPALSFAAWAGPSPLFPSLEARGWSAGRRQGPSGAPRRTSGSAGNACEASPLSSDVGERRLPALHRDDLSTAAPPSTFAPSRRRPGQARIRIICLSVRALSRTFSPIGNLIKTPGTAVRTPESCRSRRTAAARPRRWLGARSLR